ncbi:hypothetical protein [Endozoicomonas ascidiicola]|uniref:hypothetical protein n=1 Tax=Endozoicomonas ascidiicola TaxID=1698521 RepID=UPI0012FD2ED1|nr:hypothetical protein [Endozoicomonas ascidiicola]
MTKLDWLTFRLDVRTRLIRLYWFIAMIPLMFLSSYVVGAKIDPILWTYAFGASVF